MGFLRSFKVKYESLHNKKIFTHTASRAAGKIPSIGQDKRQT